MQATDPVQCNHFIIRRYPFEGIEVESQKEIGKSICNQLKSKIRYFFFSYNENSHQDTRAPSLKK
jgi:hypothetical protein